MADVYEEQTGDEEPLDEDSLARLFEQEDAEATATPAPTEEAAAPEPDDTAPTLPPVEDPDEPEPDAEPDPHQDPPPVTPDPVTPDHLAWAERVGISDFEAAAKKAYEQERFIGQRTAELQAARDEASTWQEYAEQLEQRAQTSPGVSDEWIQSGINSPDPSHWAIQLYRSRDEASYMRYMSAWEEYDAETPRLLHNWLEQNVTPLTSPAQREASTLPPPQPRVDTGVIVDAFAAAGVYDLDGDPVMADVAKLLPANPEYQQALRSGDPRLATMAAKALVQVVRARQATVSTVHMTAAAEAQAAAEAARRAAIVNGNGNVPTRTPVQVDTAWDPIEQELRRMGAWHDGDE